MKIFISAAIEPSLSNSWTLLHWTSGLIQHLQIMEKWCYKTYVL